MINKIMNTAVLGLERASAQVYKSASNIVSSTTTENNAVLNKQNETQISEQKTTENINTSSAITSASSVVETNADTPSNAIIANVVSMSMAKTAYSASAKLVKTADEMTKSILDI